MVMKMKDVLVTSSNIQCMETNYLEIKFQKTCVRVCTDRVCTDRVYCKLFRYFCN